MANMPGNTIILFDHIDHGNELFHYLNDITDKKTFLINGSVPLDEREDVRTAMETSTDCVTIGNTKCIAVGTNIKNVDNVAFVFSSGQAATKIIQAIGRGLRLKDGKTHVNIFDFYHDMRYSADHYRRRLRLYKEHYNIDESKIVTKTVYVRGNAEIMNI
jgi:superfamily II DNA or RNA helicase